MRQSITLPVHQIILLFSGKSRTCSQTYRPHKANLNGFGGLGIVHNHSHVSLERRQQVVETPWASPILIVISMFWNRWSVSKERGRRIDSTGEEILLINCHHLKASWEFKERRCGYWGVQPILHERRWTWSRCMGSTSWQGFCPIAEGIGSQGFFSRRAEAISSNYEILWEANRREWMVSQAYHSCMLSIITPDMVASVTLRLQDTQ